jgi:hypothetical protein
MLVQSGHFGVKQEKLSLTDVIRHSVFLYIDDVSGNQNNCYWPLHSESIARCKHHMQEKLVIAAHVWKIYDFKIEVVRCIFK